MKIIKEDLRDAVDQGILSTGQDAKLWDFLAGRNLDRPGFNATHILYYFGGMVAIGAMSLFMNMGWERFGGWGIFALSLAYGVAGMLMAHYFLEKRKLPVPAGIMVTFVLVLVPMAIFGFQKGIGFWEMGAYREYHTYIRWNWVLMELGTLAAAAFLLWRYRFPFTVMPLAVTLWYMSMDLTPFLFKDADNQWELRRWVSLWFGLFMLLLAFWIDVRSRKGRDYPFWIYLFGVLTFFSALSALHKNEKEYFLYLCLNLVLIMAGAVLVRRVFVVFGGLGVATYLSHLAYLFKDSALFPFALTLVGLCIIGLGLFWQKNGKAVGEALRKGLPASIRELIERREQG